MAEEDTTTPSTVNSDDVEALRILLHSIRGLSAVSTAAVYVSTDDETNDQ